MGVAFGAMAGMQLMGGLMQANAITAQGKYEESQANFNARMADLNAEDAIRLGDKTANAVKRKGNAIRGAQRAGMAGQGVDVGSGSAMDIQEETTHLNNLDVQEVKNNAWRESFGYQVQAMDYRNAGKFARMSARNNAKMTILNAGLSAGQTGLYAMSYYQDTGSKKPTKPTGSKKAAAAGGA